MHTAGDVRFTKHAWTEHTDRDHASRTSRASYHVHNESRSNESSFKTSWIRTNASRRTWTSWTWIGREVVLFYLNFFTEMKVIPINYVDTKKRILEKHYAKRIPSISFSFWLLIDEKIQWIVTYWKPASNQLCKWICWIEFSKNVLELNRLVINSWTPKNSASFLIAHSLKQLPRNWIIVSYADTWVWHVGYVYQATSRTYTGATKKRTDVDTWSKHSRHYDKSSIDYSIRKERSSKHRYVFFKNKKMQKYLKYDVFEYPKWDSQRYDCIDI